VDDAARRDPDTLRARLTTIRRALATAIAVILLGAVLFYLVVFGGTALASLLLGSD
jgi:hypothetical protein